MNSVEGHTPRVVDTRFRAVRQLEPFKHRDVPCTSLGWPHLARIVVQSSWGEMVVVILTAATVSLVVSVLLSSLS